MLNINNKILKNLFFILFITILISLLKLSLPYTLSIFIDNINNYNFSLKLVVLFALLAILLFFTTNLIKIITERFSYDLVDNIRSILLNNILNADDDFFLNKSENEILEYFEVDLNKIQNFFSNILPSLFINVSTILIIVIYLSLKINFIIILFIIYVLIDVVLLKICNRNQEIVLEEANYHGLIDSKIGEWLNLNKSIKYSHTDNNFIARFLYMQNNLRQLKVSVNKYYYSIWCVSLILGVLIDLSVLLFGGLLFFKQLISIGNLYLFYSYAKQLQSPLETFQQQFQYISEFNFSYRRIKQLLKDINQHNNSLKDQDKYVINNVDQITLVHTSFAYDATKLVLKDINLNLKSGNIIGLIGNSGQGKSTLCKLLVKRLVNKEANVFINDINIVDIDINSFYKEAIYLDNNPIIFKGSLIDNLLLFNNDNLDVNIDLFIKYDLFSIIGLNYDDMINPDNISLKCAQLINICRLFFTNKSLIIFDESFSEVDLNTYKKLLSLIIKQFSNSIIINITHQYNKLLNCEYIYELKDGILYEKV